MQYSSDLVTRFQKQSMKSFGEKVDTQAANAELSKLAHLIEAIMLKTSSERRQECKNVKAYPKMK